MLGQMLTPALSDDMFSGCHFKLRLLWWHSINTRWIRWGWEYKTRQKKERRELKLLKKKQKQKNKSCQMHNRDQLTWQMEVTGVTGRTWTCGGNGGVIKYIADVMWCFLHKQKVGIETWREVVEWIICILNGTFISNIQNHHARSLAMPPCFCHRRKRTGNKNPSSTNQSQATTGYYLTFILTWGCWHGDILLA